MIMPDTNTTNELALNDKQLFNMAVELENKRASLMTIDGRQLELPGDDN
jgi:hypothetical protein